MISQNLRLDPLYNLGMRAHALAPWWLARNGYALPAVRMAFELTYRCNLECEMCFQMASKEQGNELSTEEWLTLAGSIPRYAFVNVTGGEPFVKKGAIDIIDRLLQRHLVSILTNAVLLDESRIRRLVDGKLLLLGVSIDGIGGVHDRFRGKAGTFDKVVENLRLFRDYKHSVGATRPMLDIKAVLTPETTEGIDDLYDLAVDLDANFLTISLPKLNDIQFHANLVDGLDDPKVRTLPTAPRNLDIAKITAAIERLTSRSAAYKTKIRTYPKFTARTGVAEFFQDTPLTTRYQACYEPWSGLQIAPNGDVYPCMAYKFGNVRQMPLEAIWNSTLARQFRAELRQEGLFPGCGGCCYLRGLE